MIPFDNTSFPTFIEAGASCGLSFPAVVLKQLNLVEYRIANRRNPIRVYNIVPLIKSEAMLQQIVLFYAARNGSSRGFRFRDPFDFSTAPDGVSPPGADVALESIGGAYRTIKIYEDEGGYQFRRRIYKPRADGFILNGSTTGFTVNQNSGIISNGGTAGFYFDVPVRFSPDTDDLLSVTWESFQSGKVSIALEELLQFEQSTEFGTGVPTYPTTPGRNPSDGSGTPTTGGPFDPGGGAGGGNPGTPPLDPEGRFHYYRYVASVDFYEGEVTASGSSYSGRICKSFPPAPLNVWNLIGVVESSLETQFTCVWEQYKRGAYNEECAIEDYEDVGSSSEAIYMASNPPAAPEEPCSE